jgi:signal transduction histidine kinase
MASAPERVRGFLRGARSYSEMVLDGLNEAMLLVDTRPVHKPVVLANAAAQQFFLGKHTGFAQDPSLYDCLAVSEAIPIEATLARVSKREPASRVVSYRTASGAITVETDFKLLACDSGQRLVSLRFAAVGSRESREARHIAREIAERKRLEREILDVSNRERQRIGRDLHDSLGQELTGIALMLRGLARRIEQDRPAYVPAIEEMLGLVNRSIESARSLARGLLPVSTGQGGLVTALSQLAERGGAMYGIDVRCTTACLPELQLDDTVVSHLYRIAQEALTNAARHGRATRVDIQLEVTAQSFELQIADDGQGMPDGPAYERGLGLRIMSERANCIGAKLEIGPNLPLGTRVRVIGEQRAPATGV